MRRRRSGMILQHANVVRIVILGKKGVGKSALTVRFMTKRFIGEYDSSSDESWKHIALIDDEHIPLEINDTTGECSEDKLDLYVGCGDIFIIMYSIMDKESFEHAKLLVEMLQRRKPEGCSTALVGTMKDLEHRRCVQYSSGNDVANELQCSFHELSIRDGYEQVEKLFHELIRRQRGQRTPAKLKKKAKSKDTYTKTTISRKKSVHNSVTE